MSHLRMHITYRITQAVAGIRISHGKLAKRLWRPEALNVDWREYKSMSMTSIAWIDSTLPLRLALNASLIIVFGLLHTMDGALTYLGLHFNLVEEVNPLLNVASDYFGLGYSIFLLKLLCLDVLFVLYRGRHKMYSVWNTAALASAVLFYCWVIGNNLVLVTGA